MQKTSNAAALSQSRTDLAAVRLPPVTYLVGQRAGWGEAERGIGDFHGAIEPA